MFNNAAITCTKSETFGVTKDSETVVDDNCVNFSPVDNRVHTNKIYYASDAFGLTYLQVEVRYKDAGGNSVRRRKEILGYYAVSQKLESLDFEEDEYILNATFYYKSDWINAIQIESNIKKYDPIGVPGTNPITKKVPINGDIVGIKAGSYTNGINSVTFYIVKNCKPDCKTCTSSLDNCDSCESNFFTKNGSSFPTRCYSPSAAPEGFYYDNSKKLFFPCDSTCKTCDFSPEQCILCSKGYKIFSSDMKCYEAKPEGYYLDINTTPNIYKKCDKTCKSCEFRSTNCLECNTNCFNKLDKNQNVCYCSRPSYFWLDTNAQKYTPCSSPCDDCMGPNLCKSCLQDYYFKKGWNQTSGETCYHKDSSPLPNYVLNNSTNLFEPCHLVASVATAY
jgi:hypothetical protein